MKDLKFKVEFDADGFRLAALEWWDSNICYFEGQQDAQDQLDLWLTCNMSRFTEVVVK